MPAGIGYSFAPGADQQLPGGQNGQGRQGMSPQDAVKLLSLRIPERPAPSGIAPQALLQGQGAAGMAGGGGLQAIIRALMSMQGGGAGGAHGGVPSPRVIPGIQDPGRPMGPLVGPAGEVALGSGANDFGITPEQIQQWLQGVQFGQPRITVGQGAPGSSGEPLPTINTVSRPQDAAQPRPYMSYLQQKADRLDSQMAPPLF
jgi:hypothetical protein